ncbi:MAG: ABC transporter ATP-binding protein [Bacilli bacterium]
MLFEKKEKKLDENKEFTPLTEKDLKRNQVVEDNFVLSQKADQYLSLKNINKIYNRKVHAVVDFNLDVKQREFIVFVGPSGCGKSTTLRMIAGLEDITAGELIIDGKYSNDLSPRNRDIAMVFQNYSLYPNMTVRDNLAFSLKVQRLPKEEVEKRVEETAKILEIIDLLDRKPAQLSGGQRQRVALGRAIVRKAKIFLMDEPLSNLDAKLRVQMRSEIIKIHQRVKATTIYVTHDQIEAMTMADRIVVMKDGYIQQIGTPLEIYRHPANQFVASFIGSPSMNFIVGKLSGNRIVFPNQESFSLSQERIKSIEEFYRKESVRVDDLIRDFTDFLRENPPTKKHLFKKPQIINYLEDPDLIHLQEHRQKIENILQGKETEIMLGVRPEDIVIDEKGTKYKVLMSALLGEQYYVHFMYGGEEFISSIFSEEMISANDVLNLSFKENKVHLFDYLTGKTIY